jgi:hypothetical protein
MLVDGAFGYVITYLMSHLEEDIYKKIDVCAGTSIRTEF